MSSLEASLDSWTAIFLVVALHGLVLGTFFFFRPKGRPLPNRLMGVFLLLFSLNLISNVLYWTRYNLEFPHLVGIAGLLHFLYGPLILFYSLYILKPNRDWKKWEFLHLIPLIIYTIWMLPFFFQPATQKVGIITAQLENSTSGLSNTAITIATIKTTLMVAYGCMVLLLPHYGRQCINTSSNRISESNRRWIKSIGIGFLGYVGLYALYFILVGTVDFQIEYDYMISIGMSIFIFGIGYLGFFKPHLLHEAHNGSKYENSSLEKKEASQYMEQLLTYMKKEKPYINGDLKLEDLANELDIPRHHLSQVINERLGKNFFEFINTYRIREAKKILCDPDSKSYKILRVAFESGFNNKTTFNSAFKSEVGTTPSKFRKNNTNGDLAYK